MERGMPDSSSVRTYMKSKNRHRIFLTARACLMLWLSLAMPVFAAEPVEMVIRGIEGDVLKNVQETLVLPVGLVREGAVDRLWLERFAKQADAKTRTALEPFGYYNPHVTAFVEPVGERFRLLVTVI